MPSSNKTNTPIKKVLQLHKNTEYDVVADIEIDHGVAGAVVEVRKCFQNCKDALW